LGKTSIRFNHTASWYAINLADIGYVDVRHHLAQKGFGYELCIKTKLIELLLLLNRHIRQNPSDDFCPYTSQHKKVMEIVNYINNNYSEPQTLERLSGIFFLNHSLH